MCDCVIFTGRSSEGQRCKILSDVIESKPPNTCTSQFDALTIPHLTTTKNRKSFVHKIAQGRMCRSKTSESESGITLWKLVGSKYANEMRAQLHFMSSLFP